MSNTYQHKEAFCLMKYRSDDGTEEELIWNSRDGVTPFVITLRSGKFARHIEWDKDQCLPDYVPPKNSRIFVDLTKQRARDLVAQTILKYEVDGTFAKYGRPKDVEEELFKSYFKPGAPDIKEVE